MATTKNNTAESTVVEAEEATVPQQSSKPETAKVTSIKKDSEVKFYGEDGDESESILDKVKGLARNRKVIASVLTTTVLTAAVLVIRKRNSVDEQEIAENPEV
jgi:hypothetical protein